jgi:hypothetical protein
MGKSVFFFGLGGLGASWMVDAEVEKVVCVVG